MYSDTQSDTASVNSSGSSGSYLAQEKRSYEFYQRPSTSSDKENSSDVSRGYGSQVSSSQRSHASTRGHTSRGSKPYTPTMVNRSVKYKLRYIT